VRLAFLIPALGLLAGCLTGAPVRAQEGGNAHEAALAAIVPGDGRMLHGVYPGGRTGEEDDITPADVAAYEKATGARANWIMFSHNWFHGRAFPEATARWIAARGAIPYIRLMLRSDADEDHREPLYTLRAIATGRFDADLQAWGRAAARFGAPIICEYGTEMNGRWFPWNGLWNGRRKGPARFRAAYRHIISVMRKAGAHNILWVFHVNDEDAPKRKWNRFEAYYPGDAFIDILGVSIYSALSPHENWRKAFTRSLPPVMARFAAMAPAKPVIVAEMGTDVHNRHENAARWASDALAMIYSGRWKALKGWAWWNETWENDDNPAHDADLRVQSDPALAAALRKYLTTRK